MQLDAAPYVLGRRRNLVIAAETGSGKTLLAEMAILQECVERKRAGVYLAPLRSIVREKREDWDRLQGRGIRVYQTTGEDGRFDFDRARDADIIVATPEKWDAISRHRLGPDLVKRIGTIVVDEAHLVGEAGRGPGQEAMLARLPQIFPVARIVAMSGTLRNADAFARWLDADLFTSKWRAVVLHKEVVSYKKVGSGLQDVQERNAIVARLVRSMQDQGGATLVFCASRNGVRECARQLARALDLPALTLDGRATDADLRETLRRGIGFLYSGHPDYATVERLFRARTLSVLVATTTAAAGVNLPARAVVVRDLYKGMTELSPSDLGQMAGRAGRQGLEDKGYCYVIAPQDDVARVTTMLDGHPVGSRLGDDLATHVNTEIVLGHVRSRPDVERWYGRTLHAVVAPQRPDLIATLRHLLVNGLVVERDEALEPTALGRATSDAMVRVDTAIALEQFLAGRTTRTADPSMLEEELLRAVCGLPVELDEVVSRPEGEHLGKALSRYDARLARWPGGRLQYLALAACLLCGVDVRRVGVEDARWLSAQVQTDLSRFLRFLARRAHERTPGAPDVMVAAADLAATLDHHIPHRGAGALLAALTRAYSDQEQTVRDTYTKLRRQGIASLAEARPHLPPRARALADALPQGLPKLTTTDTHLKAEVRYAGRPVRVHARLAGQGEIMWSTETADLGALALAPLRDIGDPGLRDVTVELLVALSPNAWVYARQRQTITIPTSRDEDAIERVLRGQADPDSSSAGQKPRDAPAYTAEWHMSRRDFNRLVADVPACITQAAALCACRLAGDTDKIRAVARLMRRRTLGPASGSMRPLHVIAGAAVLDSKEAAELAAALLCAMGVRARTVSATCANQAAWVCAFLYQSRWYWLPIWPDTSFAVYHATIQMWQDGQTMLHKPDVGWEVVNAYKRIVERHLPLARIVAASPSEGDKPASTS